ncbi:MAG: hypothetical protein Q7J54_04660 [Candidatus Woesearchaeota archaeon]|nr:hypothetical protein [Candidatus Woesearchaeota archaeon]
MKGAISLILLFLLFVNITYAATIFGDIYDLSLNRIDNVIVEINTIPNQQYVSKNGTYSFDAPAGDYIIKANYYLNNVLESSAVEKISVKAEGRFRLDLILFPSFEDENQLLNESITVPATFESPNYLVYFLIIILVLIVLLAVFYYYKKIKKPVIKGTEKTISKEESKPSDLDQIIKLIKKEGGRATQKDLRRQIPLSEAKISLMIAELEDKGVVKKIKKGRGNIIILK